jgi:hypothetical protein
MSRIGLPIIYAKQQLGGYQLSMKGKRDVLLWWLQKQNKNTQDKCETESKGLVLFLFSSSFLGCVRTPVLKKKSSKSLKGLVSS